MNRTRHSVDNTGGYALGVGGNDALYTCMFAVM